jgi:hypothetical protein
LKNPLHAWHPKNIKKPKIQNPSHKKPSTENSSDTAKVLLTYQQHHHQQIQPKPFHQHNAMQKTPTVMVFFLFLHSSNYTKLLPSGCHTNTEQAATKTPERKSEKKKKKKPTFYN